MGGAFLDKLSDIKNLMLNLHFFLNRSDRIDGNGALGGASMASGNNLSTSSQLTSDRRQVLHL